MTVDQALPPINSDFYELSSALEEEDRALLGQVHRFLKSLDVRAWVKVACITFSPVVREKWLLPCLMILRPGLK